MNRRTWLAIASLSIVVTLANCSDQSTSPEAQDTELDRLVQRVERLREQVTSTGPVAPALRREVEDLRDDIESWQRRTGRTDISVSRGSRRLDASGEGGPSFQQLEIDPMGCYSNPRATYNAATREFCVMVACHGGVGLYDCFILPKSK